MRQSPETRAGSRPTEPNILPSFRIPHQHAAHLRICAHTRQLKDPCAKCLNLSRGTKAGGIFPGSVTPPAALPPCDAVHALELDSDARFLLSPLSPAFRARYPGVRGHRGRTLTWGSQSAGVSPATAEVYPPAPPGNPFTRADGTCPLIPPREGTDREALTKRDGTGDGLTVQRPKEIGRFFYNVAASRIGRQGPLHLSHLVTTRCSCRCPRCIWRDNRSEEMETRRSRTRTYRCAKREWLPTPTSCGQESHSRGRTSRPCAGHPEKPA